MATVRRTSASESAATSTPSTPCAQPYQRDGRDERRGQRGRPLHRLAGLNQPAAQDAIVVEHRPGPAQPDEGERGRAGLPHEPLGAEDLLRGDEGVRVEGQRPLHRLLEGDRLGRGEVGLQDHVGAALPASGRERQGRRPRRSAPGGGGPQQGHETGEGDGSHVAASTVPSGCSESSVEAGFSKRASSV